MTPPEPISADLLLEHAAFLRGLARSLVLDEARAEDVVQETYLAALRKPPPPHVRLRAWLGAVARNLALRSRRTEGRIQRRERARGGPLTVAPTENVADRLEAQRRIADAVAKLSEPGRSAVVHRYFDGLKPAEIARREGVSVRTIESRLRRAREVLRKRLDKAYGGSRSAWVVILAPSLGLTLEAIGASTASAATGSAAASATASAPAAASSAGLGAAITGVSLMSTKVVIGIAAACVAGAFFAGWQLHAPATDDDLESEASEDGGGSAAPQLTNDTALLDKARRELEAEKGRSAELAAELEALRAKVPVVDPATHVADAATPHETTKVEGARYSFHAVKDTLDKANWQEAGEAVTKMVPLLVELKDAIEAGKAMPSNVGDIQRWNAPLVTLALSTQGTVPGTGLNGSFTHPSIQVNLVYSALAQSPVPLDDGQQQRLGEIGDRYVAEDARRLAAYSKEAIDLRKTADEAALKARFFKDVDAMLTPEQQDVLHPAALRGRVGVDLFSSGIVWHTLTKPLNFDDRSELAGMLSKQLMARVPFEPEHKDLVDSATADWARSFSDAFLQATNDPTTHASSKLSGGMLVGWLPVELAQKASEHQIALFRALLDQLPADCKAAKTLRASNGLVVPVMNPAQSGEDK